MGRVVQDGEPLWLREDRAWAFALLHVEADACPECRQPWSEATDRANEFSYSAELIRCHACATSARAVRAHQAKNKSGSDGLHVQIERMPSTD